MCRTDELEVRVARHSLMPERANPTDAGLDLRAKEETVLPAGERVLVNLGVQAKIPAGCVGLLVPRSSLSKKNIVMMNSIGIIDSSYRGDILACLRYVGPHPNEVIMQDERIVQLLIVPIALPVPIPRYCDDEDWFDTERNTGGFGSTGRF